MELAIYLTELWERDLDHVEPARPTGLPLWETNSDTSPMVAPSSPPMVSDALFGHKTLGFQPHYDL